MTSSPAPSFLCLHSCDKCVLVCTDSSLCSCMVLGLFDLVLSCVSHRHAEFCKLLSPTPSPQQNHSSKERFKTKQELDFFVIHEGLFSLVGVWTCLCHALHGEVRRQPVGAAFFLTGSGSRLQSSGLDSKLFLQLSHLAGPHSSLR